MRSKETGGLRCAVTDVFAGVGSPYDTRGNDFHLEAVQK